MTGPGGRFITFEGVDGAGKSTHLDWFAEALRARGRDVVLTREPGGTPVGERLREILLAQPMHAETEALLMFAARREHLHQVIRPALHAGRWVICDRFTDATFAYQGGGRGVDPERLRALERWVQGDLQPDLTLLFDVTPEVARERLSGARDPDKFEREAHAFFVRVRNAYLERATGDPERFRIIEAGRSVLDVKKQLEEIVLILCQ